MLSFLRKARARKAKAALDAGLAALLRADHPAAKAALRESVRLAPDNVEAWMYLGMSLSSREPGAAAQALDRALALNPDHLGALYWRAEVHWMDGDGSAAARLLRRFNELAPDAPQNLARLGFAHLFAGEKEQAATAFSRAVDASGGIAAARATPVELRKAIYLDLLGRHDEARQLILSINGAGPAADLPASRYPRPMQEQAEALETLVAGRNVVVLASGPSLAALPPLLEKLGAEGSRQLCFFGFNNVPVSERLVRDATGRGLDLACMTASAVMDLYTDWIRDFLGRSEPGLFLTLTDAMPAGRAAADLLRAHPRKLYYFASSGEHPPIPGDPLHFPPVNTLMCILPLAVLGRPKNVFLFGCDGAALAGEDVYFRQGAAEYAEQRAIDNAHYARGLVRDTFFFNTMISTVLESMSVLHKLPLPPVYLCNPESAYRPFPRIGGEEFLRIISNEGAR
jgi:tetratricopeptide (TPR) repeat protein